VVVLDKTVLASGTPNSIQSKLDDLNISSLKENNSCD
jgi:zinc/manganese transport system ATP-binding protein